jgi:L-threonylcarbamoyladenylate synthase
MSRFGIGWLLLCEKLRPAAKCVLRPDFSHDFADCMNCPIGTDVKRAAWALGEGGLVAFATETVYGLGANALDAQAVARIFTVKGRPQFDPLIVHVADPQWLERLVTAVPDVARRLIDRFWPGPLTLVLPKRPIVPDLVTAGLSTVGIRMPAHPLALELIELADKPVAAPSANLFGHVSPTTAQHVADQLHERVDYILDGGPCSVGLESTVLDLSGAVPTLLRPGGVSREQIEEMIGPVELPGAESLESGPQRAPGMLTSHYATRTPLVLADADDELPAVHRLGLVTLLPEKSLARFAAVEVLSPDGDLTVAAANLFAAMRRLDTLNLDLIVARPVPETGLGRAINDRLRRAAVRRT